MLFSKYKNSWPQLAMLVPFLAFVATFTFWPILYSLKLSFTTHLTDAFPTLENYSYIFREGQFVAALVNTLIIVGLELSFELPAGLALALVMHSSFKGKALFRTIALTPMGMPTVVAGVVAIYFFGTGGYANEALYKLGLINLPVDWTGGRIMSLLVVTLSDMWKVTPLVALILLAGLEGISQETLEAAGVDGAGRWARFRYITLPLLRPAIGTALVLRAIDSFRIFEIPLILAGKSTPVLSSYAYFEFNSYNNANTSAAAANILTLIISVFALFYLMVVMEKEAG